MLVWLILLSAVSGASDDETRHVATGLSSHGSTARPASGTATRTEVSIGLLPAADAQCAVAAREVERGARLAVEESATDGKAPAVRLVVAKSQGQWSAGAGELVRLVYSMETLAVLGPVDGRAAHLAEQVVARAKGRFVLLTPWASDATLTRIKVPWFFQLTHDDARQAEALLAQIHGSRELRNVALLVSQADYDSRLAAEYFQRAAATSRHAPVVDRLVLSDGAANLDRLIEHVGSSATDGVILFAPPGLAAQAARGLREARVTAPLFGPLALASPAFLEAAGDAAEGTVLAAPAIDSATSADPFRSRYRKTYGCEPSVPAAYGYDGMMALIHALRATGGEAGEPLRTALASLRRDGLTGHIEFDASGRRAGPAPLAQIVRGRLEPLPQ